MFSLFAIAMLGLLVAGGVAAFVARLVGRGWPGDRFANARPAVVVLVGVLVACLLGWALAVAFASP